MTYEDTEYFRRRECQERAAAKNAGSITARRVHQQMAEQYAGILCGCAWKDPISSLRACGAV